MQDGEWVWVSKVAEKDQWIPSLLEAEEKSEPLKVTFSEPAKHWTDAIPIGNGRLGAMVSGGVATETLQLNEDTLWTGTPGDYTNPNSPEALMAVRKLVDNGKFAEATTEAVKLSGNQSAVYQLLGDVKFEFDDSHKAFVADSYRRELDLDTATARVKYSVVDGVEFSREHFVSYPDQVIVSKISASKSGSLSFTLSVDSKLPHNTRVDGRNRIIFEQNAGGNPRGILFSAILDLQISESHGLIRVLDEKRLRVEASDWAVVLVVASSSFEGPFTQPSESKTDPLAASLEALKLIKNMAYSDLYTRHLKDYQQLFHGVSLQLSKSSKPGFSESKIDVSTAQRVKSFRTDEDPSLVALLFQFGRYLLISCSRPGTQPGNLQGIWNKDLAPPWDGAPHLNINLPMNYWSSLPCNLRECQQPLFDYISSLSVNGSKTSRVNYQTSGWVAHQVSDIWAKTSPDRGEALWALWPMGGAWLCTHLWEHYTYTLDKGFLKNKAYPLVEGCVKFLLDWLIDGDGGGGGGGEFLETNPSTSPEHMFVAPDGEPASVSYSTTMDISIIKEVFSSIISAAEILGKSDDQLIKKVYDAQARLLPTKIARDGSIMEWAIDFEDPDVHHRHLSHLFGLYPGHTITMEKTPDLCKAADNTLRKRGDEGPGWSSVWKIALWARLRDKDGAYRMVKHLFDLVDPDREGDFEGGLYSNLFTAHPPFQIDGNLGFPAAVAEMLVQSTGKDIYLLPALPRDVWSNGCVKGLKARAKVTVNICWKEGELDEVGLWSEKTSSATRLHYREASVTLKLSAGLVYTLNSGLNCVRTISLL